METTVKDTRDTHARIFTPVIDVERSVIGRYARAAHAVEPSLCCPNKNYDATLLEKLPREIIEKDYGCGDPSPHVRPGETVLDLGSGSGKICYILSQRVGPQGCVIGVDMNDAMLQLARKHQEEVVRRVGHDNVRFIKARIQDMALDLERVNEWLGTHPIAGVEGLAAFEAECDRLRRESPAVTSESVDVVVSNCVLNLVRPAEKVRLFAEIHRVLKRGGRAVISDIVCDEDPTPAIVNDPELWSGCISGAFREDRFLEHFEEAGFYGVEIVARQQEPWRTIDGIEFRSLTVRAFKGKDGLCLERNQAVIYKGPWKSVQDDDGHRLLRGKRMAVCDKTFQIIIDPQGPYAGDIIAVPPSVAVQLADAKPFDCKGSTIRHPRQTKGQDYSETKHATEGTCHETGTCC
jgi:SAM-dependent methyltransferase